MEGDFQQIYGSEVEVIRVMDGLLDELDGSEGQDHIM